MAKMWYDISEWLLIIGGLNWGLVEFTDTNLVSILPDMIQPIIYGAVGLSAVYLGLVKLKFMKVY